MKFALRWTRRLLIACGISLLTYCGFLLIDTWIFQRAEGRQLEQVLTARGETTYPVSLENSAPAASGGLIGRMEIQRLGISAIVMEGTSTITLRRTLGHISGTALPGQPGNVGISGHRDTFFRPLRNIEPNDIITLTTTIGEYRYRVLSTRIVGPSDVSVLDPSETEILTLVTCYPFYFVGPAPKRFIVRAERVS
ncbi:MAG TPA: class D sortase [Bryobacteraceae bacterium]|jgi:sortase A